MNIDRHYIDLLKDTMFTHKLYLKSKKRQEDSIWNADKNTSVEAYSSIYMESPHDTFIDVTITVIDKKNNIATFYRLLKQKKIEIHQGTYIINPKDAIIPSVCEIGKSYQLTDDNQLILTRNYDEVYPICWKEAKIIALNEGYIYKKDIKYIAINYADDTSAAMLKLVKAEGLVHWLVSDGQRYIKINPFTGKIMDKGYTARSCIKTEDGGFAAIVQEISIMKKKKNKPQKTISK